MPIIFGARERYVIPFAPARGLLAVASVCAAIGTIGTLAAAEPIAIVGCVTRGDSSPVAGARVSAQSHTRAVVTTDATGCFTLPVATRVTTVRVDANGFEPIVRGDVARGSRLDIALAGAASSLVTIGRVSVDRRAGLSTSSAPSVTLDLQHATQAGFASVADVLTEQLALAAIRPAGGGANAPRVFAVRGPDPTETLVDIDGHDIDSANTGDFDLSQLDPSDLESVEVVYGIAPSALIGPNTIGGAINVRTLEPTQRPHGAIRLSGGSDALFDSGIRSTGTTGRIGYAFSINRRTTAGDIADRAIAFTDDTGRHTAIVGSGASSSSALVKARYALRDTPGAGYFEIGVRDQSVLRDASAALSAIRPDGTYEGVGASSVASHIAGYSFDGRIPLGARDAYGNAAASLTVRHLTSIADRSVTGPIADANSAYFFNDRDLVGDDTLEFDRVGATTSLAVKAAVRTERLTEPFAVLATAGIAAESRARALETSVPVAVGSSLAQTQRSIVARYAFDAMPRVHATLATYYSNFTSFGTSLDPRLGIVWTPSTRTALRASVGTTFQAPTLADRFVPDPLPDATDRIVHIGNPSARADRATEYALGAETLLGGGSVPTHLRLDLYRTNLRTPLQTFVPASGTGYSFPLNLGGAVYQGYELRAEREIAPATHLRIGYSIGNAYPTSVPPAVGDGSLVAGKQFLGVPLQRGNVELERESASGLTYGVGGAYEGRNNELNAPQFVTLHGTLGYALGTYHVDLSVRNLTNVYASGVTRAGAGIPYLGAAGPIPLDAYALPAANATLSLSRQF